MNIAILGNGTVGSGVVELIKSQPELELSYIYVRHDFDNSKKTADFEQIVNDDQVDTVVEVMGGLEPARTMILDAMNHHKHVVTANKAVVARYMDEFQETAKQNNVHFKFEASVGGGIPWLHNLERVLRVDKVEKIQGIFNGTSNFILDQMHSTKRPFAEVLKQAQDLGYAEADPSADIDGLDVENKLCIGTDLAYNTIVEPNLKSFRWGIRTMKAADIEYFEAHGWTVKLVGGVVRNGHDLNLVIEPTLYTPDSVLSTIKNNLNYIQLYGDKLGLLGLIGQGAGKLPTADAVVQDILDINVDAQCNDWDFKSQYQLNQNWSKANYVVRTNVDLTNDNTLSITKDGNYYRINEIKVDKMHTLMDQIHEEDNDAMAARIN